MARIHYRSATNYYTGERMPKTIIQGRTVGRKTEDKRKSVWTASRNTCKRLDDPHVETCSEDRRETVAPCERSCSPLNCDYELHQACPSKTEAVIDP